MSADFDLSLYLNTADDMFAGASTSEDPFGLAFSETMQKMFGTTSASTELVAVDKQLLMSPDSFSCSGSSNASTSSSVGSISPDSTCFATPPPLSPAFMPSLFSLPQFAYLPSSCEPFTPSFPLPMDYVFGLGMDMSLPPLDGDIECLPFGPGSSSSAASSPGSNYSDPAPRSKKTRSPVSKAAVKSSAKGKGKAKSVRKPTEVVVGDTVYEKNEGHRFVVCAFTGKLPKADVNNENVLELFLDSTNVGPLADAFTNDSFYGELEYSLDVQQNSRYTFSSVGTKEHPSRRWEVVFTLNGTEVRPLDSHASSSTLYSFHHFSPNSVVVRSDVEIGTAAFWRMQCCEVAHEKCNHIPHKHWTTRLDVDQKKRRPSRIVDHFALCKHRLAEGDSFALGRFARAVQMAFPATSRRLG